MIPVCSAILNRSLIQAFILFPVEPVEDFSSTVFSNKVAHLCEELIFVCSEANFHQFHLIPSSSIGKDIKPSVPRYSSHGTQSSLFQVGDF